MESIDWTHNGHNAPVATTGTPSDKWLRTFIAVVDAGSFTAAGRQLGVGQPAVSHAVANLEAALGTPLVKRTSRSLEITRAGRLLHERAAAGFGEVDLAVAAARSTPTAPGLVTVSVSTSLANWWLLPRLPAFKQAFPDIDLRVITTDSDERVGRDDADLWIPLGSVERPGLTSRVFRHQQLSPVASPELAAELAIGQPSDLLDAPLLHLEERYDDTRFDWGRWFDAHDVDRPAATTGWRSNDYSLVLQAAFDGQGVAIGWHHIVSDLLEQGRLVALADPITSGKPFVILRRATERRTEVDALADWLAETA